MGRAQQLPIHAGSQVQQQAGPRRSLAAAAAAAVEAPPERARLRRSAHPQQPGAPQPWQQQRQEHARQQHPRQTWQQQQQLLQPREQRQQRGRVQFSLGSEQDWSLPTGLAVTWLGTSSGTPSRERNISCTLVRMPQSVFMVDCGEGSHRQAALTGVALEQVRWRAVNAAARAAALVLATAAAAACMRNASAARLTRVRLMLSCMPADARRLTRFS